MELEIEVGNPCIDRKDFCMNCNSRFMKVRPFLKKAVVSNHFRRDVKDADTIKSIIRNVLDCSSLEFSELHKFEKSVDGNLIFRAKRVQWHIVYSVDKKRRIIFLRAIKNFTEYKRFLKSRQKILEMISFSEKN
jgi:mRNA-degrading endonuclease RelE of RelBE toxin-antitoxin system